MLAVSAPFLPLTSPTGNETIVHVLNEEKVICCQLEQINLTECSSRHQGKSDGTFSRNVCKLFSKLKLVPDNLLFIYMYVSWSHSQFFSFPVPSSSFLQKPTEKPLKTYMYSCTTISYQLQKMKELCGCHDDIY